MTYRDYVFGELAQLLGGKITKIVHDDMDGEKVYGLRIETTSIDPKYKSKYRKCSVILWLLSDFEGNAPGGFSIEEQ